ncbi:MAG: DUF3465 domain-containing protein [Marinicella sp.]
MPIKQRPAIKWHQFVVLMIAGLAYWFYPQEPIGSEKPTSLPNVKTTIDSLPFKQWVKQKASGTIVEISGRVYKLLEDDLQGDKHQRFLIEIDGVSVLVAHNIDLAPRVPITVGDNIRLKGEYEWNEKGGLIHWTHHDPKKWHEEGWIEYNGKKFK